MGFRTAQLFGVWRVAFRNVPTCSQEPFAVIFILKAGGVGSPERALGRHSGDVLLMSPLVVHTAVMMWTGQRAVVRTSLHGRRQFNDAISSSYVVVLMSGCLVNCEGVAGGGRGLVELCSRK